MMSEKDETREQWFQDGVSPGTSALARGYEEMRRVAASESLGAAYGAPVVKFAPIGDGKNITPTKGTEDSAGYDLYATVGQILEPGVPTTIPLGFCTEMPSNIHARVESRSGMALKGQVVLTGVIDADYRGEWKVIICNITKEPFEIKPGERVAQAVFRHTVSPRLEPVLELSETARGAGGFGSTGTK